jgi:hypothetical protein
MVLFDERAKVQIRRSPQQAAKKLWQAAIFHGII